MTPQLKDAKVVVYGLAKSGLAAIRLLTRAGARVTALDSRTAEALGPTARELEAQGVTPDDLVTLEDLARFPFTTKADLRANYPFGMFAVPQSKLVRIHGSSGTTGKPTVVGYTQADIDHWANLIARSIRAAGGRRSGGA